jgi:hypothetical protein
MPPDSATSPDATPSAAPPKRRFLRFSLRTFVIVVALLGVGFGLAGNFWRRVQQQRAIVAQIEAAGGSVSYNYEFGMGTELDEQVDGDVSIGGKDSYDTTEEGLHKRVRVRDGVERVDFENPPGPKFIRALLGNDVFADVEGVSFFRFSFGEQRRPTRDFDPDLLTRLPKLKVVWLHCEQVNDDYLSVVARLPELRMLSLTGEDAGAATAEGIAQLRSARRLRSLLIAGDWMRDDAVTGVAELRGLKSLGMNHSTHLTSEVFANLEELTELRQLSLFGCAGVDDSGTETLKRLTNLRVLSLNRTQITDATLMHIRDLHQLESLRLGQTNVTDAGMESIAHLARLKSLDLYDTEVTDNGLESLVELKELRLLGLGGTKVTNAGLATLGRMPQLQILYLGDTEVTDEGLVHLRSLTKLEHLSIGPHISKEAADEFQAALPGCKVWQIEEHDSEASEIE